MKLEKDYILALEGIKEKIKTAQYQAVVTVNSQLLMLYWEIGFIILKNEKEKGWGAKVIKQLSNDLRSAFPKRKGFSVRSLQYMRAFAEAYPNLEIVQQPVAQLPWGHVCRLVTKVKDADIRAFYASKAAENGWSRAVLEMQIESQLHNRTGQSTNNFDLTIPDLDSDLAKKTFKDPYIFNFLSFEEKMKERELEAALLQNIIKFLFELGTGFALVAQQKVIDVGGDEFIPDLIFYHIKLRRYIIVDLKMTDFKPEYAGKMNFYLSVFDDQYKTENEEPSIGLLLCRGTNNIIAEYALQSIKKPIGVSSFLLKGEPLPEELKGLLPPIDELEEKIEEEIERHKTWVDQKITEIKNKIQTPESEQIKELKNSKIIQNIFQNTILPLFEELNIELKKFEELFIETRNSWGINNQIILYDLENLKKEFNNVNHQNNLNRIHFHASFHTFKSEGKKAFSIGEGIAFEFNNYTYDFDLNELKISKLYHQSYSTDEIKLITEKFLKTIVEEIQKRLS